MSTYKVVLIRHGESLWNELNKFCGWFDADLSEKGVEEAKNAGAVRLLFVVVMVFLFLSLCVVVEGRGLCF